ncbi:10913_t:CDS:2 [Dentiscutata heterogama]|uniref:10913_t:CDS:1 n=1 Tax=Dentiscutata heterogama TaxID=1316150 RepID=A0ACA9L9K2_9GLOM|nr:10913_t:CDS:2 [Dentiscutata heterogama]
MLGTETGVTNASSTKLLKKGTRPGVGISEDKLIPRLKVIERLKKILQPNEDQSFYHVVCGEHGTGKTTLTRIASREAGQDKDRGIQGGAGVIYVDIPPDFKDLGDAFGKAINFAFEENISFTVQLGRKILGTTKDKSEISEWKRAMKAFKRASATYKAKHGKSPVIIYDNVSRLVHKNPEVLDILQDDAKDNADYQNYIAVFVSSEGSVPRRMESRSAWSRAENPIEIGDLSKEESINYLIDKRKVKKEEAEKLYELVGGRIIDLRRVANKSLAGQNFEVIKQKESIKALLDSKELDFTAFMELFNNYEEASEVLEKNIFAYHPEKKHRELPVSISRILYSGKVRYIH